MIDFISKSDKNTLNKIITFQKGALIILSIILGLTRIIPTFKSTLIDAVTPLISIRVEAGLISSVLPISKLLFWFLAGVGWLICLSYPLHRFFIKKNNDVSVKAISILNGLLSYHLFSLLLYIGGGLLLKLFDLEYFFYFYSGDDLFLSFMSLGISSTILFHIAYSEANR